MALCAGCWAIAAIEDDARYLLATFPAIGFAFLAGWTVSWRQKMMEQWRDIAEQAVEKLGDEQ